MGTGKGVRDESEDEGEGEGEGQERGKITNVWFSFQYITCPDAYNPPCTKVKLNNRDHYLPPILLLFSPLPFWSSINSLHFFIFLLIFKPIGSIAQKVLLWITMGPYMWQIQRATRYERLRPMVSFDFSILLLELNFCSYNIFIS